MKIGMVVFPNLTQLDLTSPYEVFTRLPDTRLYLLAETLEPVQSGNMAFFPNATLAQNLALNVLFVPGGGGVNLKLEDRSFLRCLKTLGDQAQYVTSVCTGSLLLAAAGLLQGYRATTHWQSLELLEMFGVETVAERVVIDRNRITGGGVTAGIDFGLAIAAELFDEAIAQEIQLAMEYNPAPPFQSGSPHTAPAEVVARVKVQSQNRQEKRRQIIQDLLA
ncbi:MAG: DJ-1/PfpI family protein [Cyanophyceae cyanobacterium]